MPKFGLKVSQIVFALVAMDQLSAVQFSTTVPFSLFFFILPICFRRLLPAIRAQILGWLLVVCFLSPTVELAQPERVTVVTKKLAKSFLLGPRGRKPEG